MEIGVLSKATRDLVNMEIWVLHEARLLGTYYY